MNTTDPPAGGTNGTTVHPPLSWTEAVTPEACFLILRQLCQAVQSRDLIGQAKEIVMATQHVDAAAAFAVLVDRSNRTNTPLRLVVQTVVDSASQEVDRRPGSE